MSSDKFSQKPLGFLIRRSWLCLYKKTRDERGTSIVEFAIFVLLFIMVLFGIIDFGLLLFNQQVVTNAAREGARYGIVARADGYKIEADRDPDGIKQKVEGYAKDHMVFYREGKSNKILVVPQFESGLTHCEKFRDVLTVDVTYDYYFLFLPFARKTLEAQTKMICE